MAIVLHGRQAHRSPLRASLTTSSRSPNSPGSKAASASPCRGSDLRTYVELLSLSRTGPLSNAMTLPRSGSMT